MTTTLKTVGSALEKAYSVLDSIAARKGHSIKSLTVDVANTDLTVGKVTGTVTVDNRSRRKFSLTTSGAEVTIKLLGETRKLAA